MVAVAGVAKDSTGVDASVVATGATGAACATGATGGIDTAVVAVAATDPSRLLNLNRENLPSPLLPVAYERSALNFC